MKHSLICLLAITVVTVAAFAEAPPQVPLRAADGTVLALWQKDANPNKPYLAQFFAPGDKPVALLDDSPPDHFHHHGLMFAVSVDGTDFWAEKGIKNAGREVAVESLVTAAGDGFRQRLRWLAADGTHLLDESRRVLVRKAGKDADTVHWLDWVSVISPAAGRDAVKLSGGHYFGLGMRFLPAWTDKGKFIWSDVAGQATVRGDEKLTPGLWCAVSCELDGRVVTLLMIDHPSNSRLSRWFTMGTPFCYLSAALGLDTRPASLAAGQHWMLRYGLAVINGPADRARLAKLAGEWAGSRSFPTSETTTPAKP